MKVKVLQLNIWYGRIPGFENLISFLKQEDADIMFFQEVHNGESAHIPVKFRLFSELSKLFPEHEGVFEAGFCDITPFGNIESGNATLIRGKITGKKNIFFDVPYKTFDNEEEADFENTPQTLLEMSSEIDGKTINTFNIHGIWGFDGRDSERRFKMADKIIKSTQGKENVILAGDFNLNPDTEAVRNIENHLKNVFSNTLISTFNTKRKKTEWAKNKVVDMIFVSPSVKILEKRCSDVDVSDHLPLIAELEV